MITVEKKIPANKVEKFSKDILRINKKALKIGHGGVDVVFTDELQSFVLTDKDGDDHLCHYYSVLITYEPVKIDGYTFVGKVTFTDDTPIITHFNNDKAFKEYQDIDPRRCDHCGVRHVRKAQYIFNEEDTNNEIVVGHSCVKAFTGITPQNYYSFLSEIEKLDDFDYTAGSFTPSYSVEEAVRAAFCTVEKHGWRSSTEEFSTADAVRGHFAARSAADRMKITDEQREKAAAALEWIKNTEATNDFMYNLKALATKEHIEAKHLNRLVAITVAYHNFLKSQEERKISEWVGEVKERKTFELKVVNRFYNDTAFGIVTVFIMEDKDGNKFVWRCSSDALTGAKNDVFFTIKGTIKDHAKYKGIKQTHLTRCKVLDEEG